MFKHGSQRQSGDPWELLKSLEGAAFGSVVACSPVCLLTRLMTNQITTKNNLNEQKEVGHIEMFSHAKNVTATIPGRSFFMRL
jgi:hypothetical protein